MDKLNDNVVSQIYSDENRPVGAVQAKMSEQKLANLLMGFASVIPVESQTMQSATERRLAATPVDNQSFEQAIQGMYNTKARQVAAMSSSATELARADLANQKADTDLNAAAMKKQYADELVGIQQDKLELSKYPEFIRDLGSLFNSEMSMKTYDKRAEAIASKISATELGQKANDEFLMAKANRLSGYNPLINELIAPADKWENQYFSEKQAMGNIKLGASQQSKANNQLLGNILGNVTKLAVDLGGTTSKEAIQLNKSQTDLYKAELERNKALAQNQIDWSKQAIDIGKAQTEARKATVAEQKAPAEIAKLEAETAKLWQEANKASKGGELDKQFVNPTIAAASAINNKPEQVSLARKGSTLSLINGGQFANDSLAANTDVVKQAIDLPPVQATQVKTTDQYMQIEQANQAIGKAKEFIDKTTEDYLAEQPNEMARAYAKNRLANDGYASGSQKAEGINVLIASGGGLVSNSTGPIGSLANKTAELMADLTWNSLDKEVQDKVLAAYNTYRKNQGQEPLPAMSGAEALAAFFGAQGSMPSLQALGIDFKSLAKRQTSARIFDRAVNQASDAIELEDENGNVHYLTISNYINSLVANDYWQFVIDKFSAQLVSANPKSLVASNLASLSNPRDLDLLVKSFMGDTKLAEEFSKSLTDVSNLQAFADSKNEETRSYDTGEAALISAFGGYNSIMNNVIGQLNKPDKNSGLTFDKLLPQLVLSYQLSLPNALDRIPAGALTNYRS